MSVFGTPVWGVAPRRTFGFAVASVVGAALLGFAATRVSGSSLSVAAMVCVLPLVPFLIARPEIPAVGAIAVLPFGSNVAGGATGLQIGAPDLLMAVAFAGMLFRWSIDPVARARAQALRPMLPIIAIYLAVALLVTVDHSGFKSYVALVQRFELVGVPLLIGATLLSVRAIRIALRLFVLAALVLATTALIHHQVREDFLGVQKNPAGQFVADALLIVLVTVKRLPLRIALAVYLAFGMYFTYSRGAITGILVGLSLLIVLSSPDLAQAVVRVGVGVVLALAIFHFLPQGSKERLLGNVSTTEFNDKVRKAYRDDAEVIIDQHPYLGIGLGNYLAGNSADLTLTTDPHDVYLLETAEGGYVLVAAFGLLQAGALGLLLWRGRGRTRNRWVSVAVATQASILVHAAVDVYWVRGTPVLGWLVVGLAFSSLTPSPASDAKTVGRQLTPAGSSRLVLNV